MNFWTQNSASLSLHDQDIITFLRIAPRIWGRKLISCLVASCQWRVRHFNWGITKSELVTYFPWFWVEGHTVWNSEDLIQNKLFLKSNSITEFIMPKVTVRPQYISVFFFTCIFQAKLQAGVNFSVMKSPSRAKNDRFVTPSTKTFPLVF